MRRPSPQNGLAEDRGVKIQNLGERNASRPLFPNVNCAGTAKALVLKTAADASDAMPSGHDPDSDRRRDARHTEPTKHCRCRQSLAP